MKVFVVFEESPLFRYPAIRVMWNHGGLLRYYRFFNDGR